jgi:hypothetical protein
MTPVRAADSGEGSACGTNARVAGPDLRALIGSHALIASHAPGWQRVGGLTRSAAVAVMCRVALRPAIRGFGYFVRKSCGCRPKISQTTAAWGSRALENATTWRPVIFSTVAMNLSRVAA